MNRRKIKENIKVSTKTESTKMTPESSSMIMDLMDDSELHQNQKVDSYCKVDFLPNSAEAEKTFICNRYSDFNTGKFDTEVQTEIIDVKGKIILSQKKFKNKECNTPIREFVDQSTETHNNNFLGFRSILKDEQLTDLAGVSFNNFNFFVKKDNLFRKMYNFKKGSPFNFLNENKNRINIFCFGCLV